VTAFAADCWVLMPHLGSQGYLELRPLWRPSI
jgi:hypothetical protein